VIGFDIDAERVRELQGGHDRTREVDAADLRRVTLDLTSDKSVL
jgi:UDP-N-acetyl-D-galactosamine dehydrogenase